MLFRIALCLAVLCGVASAQQITSLPPVVTTSLAATLVVKAAPGTLYSVYATNLTGGTSGYLVLYNATAAPTPGALTGALVLDCVPFNSLGEAIVSYQGYPAKTFDKGIVALVTSATTCYTYTTGVLTAYISAIRQ